ncbi:MAG: TIGR00730 family Rossman fold protein [Burkholderiaceae bacterium]|jgi:uncharacterized protein (TIGR00730 family)|nr:TIGR00730 family Rossman fold protein [Burkholderiaceae bacterium]
MSQDEKNEKNIVKLREVKDVHYATILKARESWSMFSIMSEFIETTEQLSELNPAVTVFGSARIHPDNPWYIQCMEVCRHLSDAGFAVISGGGPGIMAAANRGAFEGKSLSVGLNIDLPKEQTHNRWQNISLNFRHFFPRKVAFAKYADAYVLFPGGFGTLDELCEVLTLIQTGKSRKIPIILVGSGFWNGFLDWLTNTLVPSGTLSPEDVALMKVTDDSGEVLDEIFRFYEVRDTGPSDEERERMMYL